MTISVFEDIANRRKRIEKALRGGSITPRDGAALMEGYAYIYKDGAVPILGMGRSGSADIEGIKKQGLENQYAIPFIITTYREDRDGDIVIPLGWRGENYARNPVWFFGHQQWEIPIGKATGPDGKLYVFPEEKIIRSVCFFDKDDPDAMYLYGKVIRGYLNATSIAFVPIDAARRDNEYSHEKARTHSENLLMPPGWLFKIWDHTETSVVGVGSNAGAIRDSLDHESDYITPKLQKALRPFAAEARGCWNGWCAPIIKGRRPRKGDRGSQSNAPFIHSPKIETQRVDTAYALNKAGAEPTFQTGDSVVATYADSDEVPLDKVGKVVDVWPGTTSLHDPEDVEGVRGDIVPAPSQSSQFQQSDYGGEPQAVGTQQTPLSQKPVVAGETPSSSTKYLVDFGDRKLWISEEALEEAPGVGNDVKQNSAGTTLAGVPSSATNPYRITNNLPSQTQKIKDRVDIKYRKIIRGLMGG